MSKFILPNIRETLIQKMCASQCEVDLCEFFTCTKIKSKECNEKCIFRSKRKFNEFKKWVGER